MAYEASLNSDAAVAPATFRRDERFAVLFGGAAVGIAAGFGIAMALGRANDWAMYAAIPFLLIASYFAVATLRDAVDRRAIGCSIAAAMVVLSLLAWPAMAVLFPMSAPQFWIAPGAGMVSMLLLASCWTGTHGASYRLMGEAASLCLIVGFLGFNTLMA
ncbi:MAG: hypothetical protein NT015_19205 [Alphaproteobacteria bacterium]|nr:hypothetical protein [Alphaproteobacteria bacterium]